VATAPTVYLGDQGLVEVIWVDTATLSATVPWGLVPQAYSLTVVNPDGISATLSSAFTVTKPAVRGDCAAAQTMRTHRFPSRVSPAQRS